MCSNPLDKSINLLEVRFKERYLEVEGAFEEMAILLNGDAELLEKLFIDFSRLCVECNLEQVKTENNLLKKAKSKNKEISKKALELYALINEMEDISGESVASSWQYPYLDSLQIIQNASEFNYQINKDKDKPLTMLQKELYAKTFGETINKILKEDPDDALEYFPDPRYIFYAVGKFYEEHSFHSIERQSSPRALLRAFLKYLVFSVKLGIYPSGILSISIKSMTNIISVALDLRCFSR